MLSTGAGLKKALLIEFALRWSAVSRKGIYGLPFKIKP
jgi:hypothetical protein